ncbi:MAG: V-type ATP synthase subunit B [Candidatus Korarchaeota archaeon]|nr:V-type ATP synthase subunit B [Thermoproteota archaeon]MCR8463142.1 V-type ATP synthase subunit B [Thermoproteota archaeon]MCR8471017.1 V-type ATP synthase subunit B [Thermoproteota archaeon]MCR8471833.1 V-type ATP synthase subunit B [Thermoproteota archaeon]MCR8472809.1 V-type ATP synthase subunit B [Thermoproteota archaeon]
MAGYGLEYRTVRSIEGTLIVLEKTKPVGYNELVEVVLPDGTEYYGSVIDTSMDYVLIQVFGRKEGLERGLKVRLTGEPISIPLSEDVLGRVLTGSFKPRDHLPPIIGDEKREIFYSVINPAARAPPEEFIQTGISIIDACLALVRGQKLPIFTLSGLPHNMLLAQIARQATILKKGAEAREDFAVVFCAMGLRHEEYEFFRQTFEKTGALHRSVMILNLADEPEIERIIAPRVALTVAEYLAFDLDYHVLVILGDMLSYAEILRVLSTARREIPARKGYPGYLYTDLATIYERCGKIKGMKGSVTLMPYLTMPGGDITHPVVDLSGYITEGQIILSNELHMRGIYPPVDLLNSLSRLAKDGIGKGKTREDHKYIAEQLYASYAAGIEARELAKIIGERALSERERKYLEFTNMFERKFISQGYLENRSIEQTLELAWDLLATLPEGELTRIPPRIIHEYHPKYRSKKVT